MIVTKITINTNTREDVLEAIEALAKNLREHELPDAEKNNSILTDHSVVVFSMNEES